MATSIDTAVTVAARKGQVFTMSDGNLVAVYYNGTSWGYRVKASGTWGSRTALTSSPASTGACWAQDGDNLFGAVSGSGVSFYVYKLAYNAATDAVTQTNTLTGDNVPVLAAYLDTTNARFNVVAQITSAGVYLYSFATSNLATGIAATAITAGTPPATGQVDTTWAAAGAGAGTWYLAWFTTVGATVFNVVTMVTTATAITSQTAETSEPALAANCAGLDAAYDGTNVTFAANQNNAALRVTRRTGANTYDAWSTLVTETVAGKPSLARKTGGGDLLVAYRSSAGQANGEIATFKRLSGTWDASKATLAGGASTGWSNPVLAPSDVNQGVAGTVPVAYLTGTANPWALVEDSTSVAASGITLSAVTGTANASGGTDALTVQLAASSGAASANGGTVTTGTVTGLTATAGTASAAGGTTTPRFTYLASAGTAAAAGPTVTAALALNASTGAASGGGTVTARFTFTAAGGAGTAAGSAATASTAGGPLSAVTGTANATGGTDAITARWAVTSGIAAAAGGSTSFAKSHNLTAAAGNAAAAAGTAGVTYRWAAATGTAAAAGGAAAATAFVPTLGHIDGAAGTITLIEPGCGPGWLFVLTVGTSLPSSALLNDTGMSGPESAGTLVGVIE